MRTCLFYFLVVISHSLFAQTDSLINDQKVVGFKVHYGSVLVHSVAVQNISGSMPFGFEVEYSKQKINDSTWNLCDCYPRTGIAASYFNFNNKILGSGISMSYFLEPHYRLTNKSQLLLRGALGAIYASRPYEVNKNPDNHNYPSSFNPYLQIGAGLGYQLNHHTTLLAMGSLQHFSNGGFKQPNRGLNWMTASLGILYYPGNSLLPKFERRINRFWKGKRPELDIGFMYVPRQDYNSQTKAQRKYLFGGFAQLTKQVGRTNALTLGGEIYYSKLIEDPVTVKNQAASPYFAGVFYHQPI
jgi:hypothetical protein